MATIEMSSDFVVTAWMIKLFTDDNTSNAYQRALYAANSDSNTYRINIMKGTVPTDFSTLTSTTSRASDVLITFPWQYSGNPFNISVAANPAVISTSSIVASASGTATWYWYQAFSGTTLLQQSVGTVGTEGSGESMEISSVTITAGDSYSIRQYRIQIPTSWTY